MSYVKTFRSSKSNIDIDIYNDEIIEPGRTDSLYFITPERLIQIELWRMENSISNKLDIEQYLDFFIQNNWVGRYKIPMRTRVAPVAH